MSKSITTLVIIALLLSATLSQASRPHPKDAASAKVVEKNDGNPDEGCGEDMDCLMRRTLAAHTDYIYTQGGDHKH